MSSLDFEVTPAQPQIGPDGTIANQSRLATTLTLDLDATGNPPNASWLCRLQIMGRDPGGAELLFPLMGFRIEPLNVPPFFGLRASEIWTIQLSNPATHRIVDTTTVLNEALDEDPAELTTIPFISPTPILVPQFDTVFARASFETVTPGTSDLPDLDSQSVSRFFEF